MSKCWYCNEEITTGNNPEHLGICDKCYNSMFKVGNDFVKSLTDKTTDLEAKLAESDAYKLRIELAGADETIQQLKQQLAEKDQAIEGLQEINKSLGQTCNNDAKEIERLREELAEKDKEIESLKNSSDKNIDYLIEFASLITDEKDCNRMLRALAKVKEDKKYIVDKDRQDKISFAVDILEEIADCSNYINSKLDFECGSYVSEKAIRDKIKYLKGNEDE